MGAEAAMGSGRHGERAVTVVWRSCYRGALSAGREPGAAGLEVQELRVLAGDARGEVVELAKEPLQPPQAIGRRLRHLAGKGERPELGLVGRDGLVREAELDR